MSLFLSLVIVHLLADFFLQRDAWIQSKIKYKIKSLGLFKHICVHLFLNAFILYLFLNTFDMRYFTALFCIVLSHYAIDIWKSYQQFGLKAFLLDQLAHYLILIMVCLYISESGWAVFNTVRDYVSHRPEILAPIAGVLFLSKPFSFIVQLSLTQYTKDFEKNEKQSGLGNAGEWIGILERLLVFTFVLLGQFGGVGFLLAAKSVFRFGDMREQKDRKLTEYIMLGSLLSIGGAIFVALLVSAVIS